MNQAINRFYNSIENVESQNQGNLIELFVFFLTSELGQDFATAKQVAECFVACDLTVPANVSARLINGLKTKPPKYIKSAGGYRLHRSLRDQLSKKLGGEISISQTSTTLRNLEHKLPLGADKNFLKEAIDCFEIGANRASIIMTWILTMDHLFDYILAHKIVEFNAALAKDKGVKISSVAVRDDFTEIKESKFIELCRSSGIISNDVRKILEQKLGTRNSCAHPSGININKSKVVDFIEDLVDNVILKFAV